MSTILNISIPTAARGAVRAFIKGNPLWEAWAARMGIESRAALNSHLLAFAAEHGLNAEVERIIQNVMGSAPVAVNPFTLPGARVNRAIPNAAPVVPVSGSDIVADALAEAEVAVSKGTRDGAFEALDILKGVEQFLSPLVKAELEKALAPVVEAANKPAVVQEVERVVEKTVRIDGNGVVIAPVVDAPVKTGKTVPFNKLFGTSAAGDFARREITLWNSHGLAPEVDAFFVVDPFVMGMIATAAECGDYVWQVGPSGSGKTTGPKQFAAYTGRRFFHVQCTKQTEVSELVGGYGAKGGNTFWQDGALVEAMRVPGAVILIDEPCLTGPGVQAIFQAVTNDSREYTIHATGEVVQIAEGVIFIVGDNTNGTGDDSGQYAGTSPSNAALVNRFRRMVKVDYMSKAQEAKALVNWTSIPLPAAEHVVDFFARARRLPEMEGVVMSLRQMTGFVRTVKDGFTSKQAFEVAILNKLPQTERAAVDALATLDWHDGFERALTGAPKPTMSNLPSDSAGAKVFDDGKGLF